MTDSLKPRLILLSGRPMTTSLVVAQHFEKRHDNVLRDIEELLAGVPADFRRLNFEATSRNVPGPKGAVRTERMYRMTRDGFSLLAMGFTGTKALRWKVAYIDAFNRMEEALRRQPPLPSTVALGRDETLLTLFIGLSCRRGATAIAWYVLHHGGEGVEVRATVRGISGFCEALVSKSGVMRAMRVLARTGDATIRADGRRGSWILLRAGFLHQAFVGGTEALSVIAQLPALPPADRAKLARTAEGSGYA